MTVPEYTAAVPGDDFNAGSPLSYRRVNGGYELSSVGLSNDSDDDVVLIRH